MAAPAGVTLTPEHRAARQAWVDRNPLRSWRLRQDPRVTILEAAELVGVGMSMIQMYEKGVHKPSRRMTDRLNAILGENWNTAWDAWLAERPTL